MCACVCTPGVRGDKVDTCPLVQSLIMHLNALGVSTCKNVSNLLFADFITLYVGVGTSQRWRCSEL
jgi:hypothetical protein